MYFNNLVTYFHIGFIHCALLTSYEGEFVSASSLHSSVLWWLFFKLKYNWHNVLLVSGLLYSDRHLYLLQDDLDLLQDDHHKSIYHLSWFKIIILLTLFSILYILSSWHFYFCNWKFVLLNPLWLFCSSPYDPPLYLWNYFCSIWFFFYIPYLCKIIWYLSFSNFTKNAF